MSGIPTRKQGCAPRAATTLGGPSGSGISRLRPPSGIPVSSTSRLPRSLTNLQRPMGVNNNGPRSNIPTQTPVCTGLPQRQFTSGAIPRRVQMPSARPKSGEPSAATKSISVQRKTKSGPQIVTKVSSRMISQVELSNQRPAKKSKQLKTDEWAQTTATTSRLEQELETSLLECAAQRPKTALVATKTRKSLVDPPTMLTKYGPIPVQTQVISTKSVTKQPGQPDIVGRDIATIEVKSPCRAERTEIGMSRITPQHPHSVHSPRGKEAVIVQSKVAIAPGYRQTIKTVTYEGDPDDVRQASVLPSPQAVARLVQDETEMINKTLAMHMPDVKRLSPSTYPLRKRALEYSMNAQSVGDLENHELCATCMTAPPEMDEPTPEMIAEMMNTDERGLAMEDAPTNVYNYLFSRAEQEKSIEVISAAPFPFQDVVVPTKVPNMATEMQNEDVMDLTMQACDAATSNSDDNTYCAIVGDAPLQSKNAARKGGKTKRKRVTLLANEPPPWGAIQDAEPVVDVVGAPLAANRTVREEVDEEVDPMIEGIEYLLQMEAPQHYSQVQLRGSQKPTWFPGYLMALPDVPNLVTVARSPSEVFAAAWRATQPDIFNDDSVFII